MTNWSIEQQRAIRWLATEGGQQLLAQEQQLLDVTLPRHFGAHLLQCSVLGDVALSDASPANHRFSLATEDQQAGAKTAISDLQQLPLEDNAVDVVVLHHILEFSEHPHAVLREMCRVLRPEGCIIVQVFNPWSLLNLQQRSLRRLRADAWHCHALGGHRVTDWLQLLDCDIGSTHSCAFTPVFNHATLRRQLAKLESPLSKILKPFGGSSMIVAKKKSATLIPVRKRWRKLAPALGVPVIKPSARAAKVKHEQS